MRQVLRDALTGIGRGGARILTPLGLLPSFTGLCADMIQGAIAAAGLVAEDTTVVLAAHGSARGPRPAACAQALCQRLEQETPVRQVVPGYLEEAPFLADSLREAQQPAICLPCFVTNAFHATSDVPEAIAESGFQGLVLPAAGTIPETVELIARELEATHSEASAA